ncbi:MAG: Ig-like domain-containing protein [Gemmatimonadota bacterium]
MLTFPLRRGPLLGSLLLLGVFVGSCTDGSVTGGVGSVELGIAPSFQIVGGSFEPGPVDRIVIRAIESTSGDVLGTTDEQVDPTAQEWGLDLAVETGTEPVDVLVEVELYSGGSIAWSGRGGPVRVEVGSAPAALEIPVFPGPLDNLDVVSLTILDAPAQILAGSSVDVTAEVELPTGSTASPVLYWGSDDETVLTADSPGLTASVTGVAAGTAELIVVAGSETATASVEVLPAVSSVTVTPDSWTFQSLATVRQFDAEVIDGFGNPDPDATISWSTNDPAIATVDGDGFVTAVAIGSTEVVATSSGVSGSATITVEDPPPPGFDVEWLGLTSDWDEGTNWNTGQVPQPTQNVYIGTAGVAPTLFSTVTVGDLTVETGVTLGLEGGSITVTGDLDAGQTISGGGTVRLEGTGTVVSGTIGADVFVGGTVTANGTTTFGADLTIEGTGVFEVGAQQVNVGSELLTTGSGALSMTGPGTLQVGGPASFFGGSTTGLLTNGFLRVGGDLAEGGVNADALEASGSHWVEMTGIGAVITGASPVLANIDFLADGPVTVTTGVQVSGFLLLSVGSLEILDGVTVDAGQINLTASNVGLYVDGTLTGACDAGQGGQIFAGRGSQPCASDFPDRLWEGALSTAWEADENWRPFGAPVATDFVEVQAAVNEPALTVPTAIENLVVGAGGAVDQGSTILSITNGAEVAGSLDNGTTELTGSFSGTFDALRIIGGADQAEDVSVGSGLEVTGSLNTAGFLLQVAANTTSSGTLTVPTGSLMQVAGDLTLGAGSNFGVDGTVEVGGTCIDQGATISGSGTQPCGAAGFSKVWIGGDAGGPTDWNNPNNWTSAGVPGATDEVLVQSAPGPVLSAPGSALALTVQNTGSVDLGGQTLSVGRDLDAAQPITNGTIRMTGSGTLFQGTVDDLELATPIALSSQLTVTGSVSVEGVDLVINDQRLDVSGDLTITGFGGRLIMQDVAGIVDVRGTTTFNNGSTAGLLNAGTMLLGGDLTGLASQSSASFAGTGAHQVVLDGDGDQTINFATPGTNQMRFQDLTVLKATGTAIFTSDLVATGDVVILTGSAFDASGQTASIQGSWDDQSGAALLGTLEAVGPLTTISSPLDANFIVGVNMTLPADLTVNGDVELDGADLIIGANTLNVVGDFTTTGFGANLTMQDPAGVLDLDGNAQFNGGTTLGFMTDGTLRVAGDLVATSPQSGTSFAASGSHATILDGSGGQTVNFSTPSQTGQRFHHLTVDKAGGTVTFATNFAATGDVVVTAGSGFDATGLTGTVQGSWDDQSGAAILGTLNAIGDLTTISSPLPGNLTVGTTLNLPADLAVSGDVLLNGQDLVIGTTTMSVAGNFTTTGFGANLTMQDAAGVLDIEGDAFFSGGTTLGFMTDGTLRIAGDLTATSPQSGTSFAGSGNHQTILDGAGAQTVDFSTPGSTGMRFHDVTIDKAGGTATFTSDFAATGAVVITAGTDVDAPAQTGTVLGSWDDQSGAATLGTLNAIGDLAVISSPLPGNLTVNATLNLAGNLVVPGNVLLDSDDLVVGANTLTIGGDLTTSGFGANLTMTDAAGVIDLAGNANFNGGTTLNFMTAGELRIAGDLTATSPQSGTSFAANQTHTTIFDGTGAQTVNFSTPGTTQMRFQNLTADKASGTLTFTSDFVASGNVVVTAGTDFDAPAQTLSAGGSWNDQSGTATLGTLNAIGSIASITSPLPANLTVSTTLNLGADLVVNGDVLLNGNDFVVGSGTISVSGNFTASGFNANLTMLDGAGILDIEGDAAFNGGTTVGFMTAGTLRVAGDLTGDGSQSGSSFGPTGTHQTILDGTTAQTISFTNPSLTGMRFNDLQITNTSATLTFESDAFVSGDFDAGAVALSRGIQPATLEIRGVANIDGASFAGMPVRLISTTAGSGHTMDNLSFSGMDPADFQLFLQLPGGVNTPLNMNGIAFDVLTFTTGGHIQTQRNTGGLAEPFVAQFFTTTPDPITGLAGPDTQIFQF